jgi:hypothetical protein
LPIYENRPLGTVSKNQPIWCRVVIGCPHVQIQYKHDHIWKSTQPGGDH